MIVKKSQQSKEKQPVVVEKPTVIAATPTAQPAEVVKPVEITPVKEPVVEKPVVNLPEVTTSQEKTISDCLVDFVGPMGPMIVNMHKKEKALGITAYLKAVTSAMDSSMREKIISTLKTKGIY